MYMIEALIRVLDDNRELSIPEKSGERIRARSGFRSFEIQNPTEMYVRVQEGPQRSRAYTNRFIELHFDNLSSAELETILTGRCCLPGSYIIKMVRVLGGELKKLTLRGFFKWAERCTCRLTRRRASNDLDKHLAEGGLSGAGCQG